MDEVKEAIVSKSAKMVSVKDYESKLAAVLTKIRDESLDKLRWHGRQRGKLFAIIQQHESKPRLLPCPALDELVEELKSVLSEVYSDDTRYGLPSGYVDQPQRADEGAGGSADCPPGEPNGESD
jgi:hypothetical protein